MKPVFFLLSFIFFFIIFFFSFFSFLLFILYHVWFFEAFNFGSTPRLSLVFQEYQKEASQNQKHRYAVRVLTVSYISFPKFNSYRLRHISVICSCHFYFPSYSVATPESTHFLSGTFKVDFFHGWLALSLSLSLSPHTFHLFFFIHFYLYRLVLISFVASENCRSAVVFSIVINGTADWKKRLQSLSKHLQVFFELQLETNALSLSDGIWVLGNSSFQIRFIYVSL